jgi:hypothetical protein
MLIRIIHQPSIQVQPSEVQITSFKFTLTQPAHLKIYIYMNLRSRLQSFFYAPGTQNFVEHFAWRAGVVENVCASCWCGTHIINTGKAII